MTPNKPVPTVSIRAALATLANRVGSNLPHLPAHPGIEILRKAKPRLIDGAPLPSAVVPGDGHSLQEHDYIGAITEAVLKLDHSYLAVQGPPGTGKTHVGSHIIANLIAKGWKVGVVGQSHAVVENMLSAAVEKAGVNAERVGKKLAAPHDVPWKIIDDKAFGKLLDGPEGALIGGTAWTHDGCQCAGGLPGSARDRRGRAVLAR
ncbi:AAA domain-containing protein [Arthrobacter psychrolactophilus]